MPSFKNTLFAIACMTAAVSALPTKREVPQEHSHEDIIRSVRASLQKNNPAGIVDDVFGLLGNAAAANGLGKIADVNCLQQATADQAFTNAKAAGDVQGQVDALIFRALERNTATVGGISAPCTSIKATNPEIAAIQQHQDPASPGAAAANKAVVLALAKQIKAVGGNPQDALKSGTFKPGNLNDKTGKGNTCDDANDANGCINTLKLLVPDATAAEIDAAVGGANAAAAAAPAAAAPAAAKGAKGGKGKGAKGGKAAAPAGCPAAATVTVTAA
ncbi:hypothetical protein BD410DRAFT_815144 [Rickenella mellea]|uniref:Cell wall protein n=1 Tax=Rickenella mellea TaxID=50990 RepID=A0A4Y7Q4M6_9AGAM|nr:hypothetical protein BD410DRAFT_815144 [Rickenella mellea]